MSGQRFIPADREQQWLMPPSLREWLPGDHLAWFVIDCVGGLELQAFYGAYRADGQGRPAHDPGMMVALLLYNYAVGERSSRRIERRCVEDVPTRVIAANQAPDFSTICRFRQRFAEPLAGLFTDILVLCAKAGLVRVGTVAIDGTKLAANASMGANRSYGAIRDEVDRWLEEAEQVDAAEDELFGDRRGDELPPELADPAGRRARLAEAKAKLEAEQAAEQAAYDDKLARREQFAARTGKQMGGRKPQPPQDGALFARKANVTDLDSRIVSHRGMRLQGYNAQAAVADGQIILAARITTDANDQRQLAAMTTAAQTELAGAGIDGRIAEVLADSGYWNSDDLDALAAQHIDTLVPTHDLLRSTPRHKAPRQGPHAQRIDALLATPEGAARYRRRQQIVEPVFAHIKHLRGITRFARRGKHAVQAEWQLIAATHNLLKLHRATPVMA
jgi:transposase